MSEEKSFRFIFELQSYLIKLITIGIKFTEKSKSILQASWRMLAETKNKDFTKR